MRIAICCIVKLENHYIREWVEHYKNINVDNVIIYDNNDTNGECLTEVIDDYIKDGFVIIENCRGKEQYQCKAYKHCFQQYKDLYDYIGFFDADEFLDVKNVKVFLENKKDVFSNFCCIRIPWRIYDDNNIVETNNNYSIKRFTKFHNHRGCKSIINTKFNIGNNMTPHGPLNINACDPNGKKCDSKDLFICNSIKEQNYDVWLNHYMLKTIDEYIHHKQVRLYPDQTKKSAISKLTLERFFAYNELTDEKINYLKKQNIRINLSDFNNLYLRDKGFK